MNKTLKFGLSFLLVPLANPVAQEISLWRLESATPAQAVPPYQGGLSPFAMSAPEPVVTAAVSGNTADNTNLAMQRETLIQQAKQMIEPQRALIPKLVAPAKAVTNGPKGLRVLVGGEWLGKGEALPVRYDVNADTRQALRELQKVDAEAAQKLANSLEQTMRDYGRKPNVIDKIDLAERRVTLKGPMGNVTLPIYVNQ